MDNRRAQEIIAASQLIDVVYKGSHIYIQKVNEQNKTASIYHLDNPNCKQEVALENLIEQ